MTGTEDTENNTCMLYEAANQTPVYEVYQKLCKFQGNCDIEYVDFEKKYYRFYHGNSEEESAKSISSKTFSDLPIDIIKIVIKDLELVDKLSLRKVSKTLQSVVDGHKFESSTVRIYFKPDSSEIDLGEHCIEYYDENDKSTYKITTWSFDSDGDAKKEKHKVKPRVLKEKHWEAMIRDLSTIFETPNWKIAYISLEFFSHFEEDKLTSSKIRQKQIELIENMLKTTPLQVEAMSISSREHAVVMAILPYVVPGSLESLDLNSQNNGAKLEEVVELEQWKGLNTAGVGTVPDSFPIEHFFHLEVFTIDQIRISEDRLVKIRDILFKCAKFSFCSLTFRTQDQLNVDENGHEITPFRALDILINRVMGEHPEYNADTRCYSIPDSDEHFSLHSSHVFHSLELEIKREKNGQEDAESSFDELP